MPAKVNSICSADLPDTGIPPTPALRMGNETGPLEKLLNSLRHDIGADQAPVSVGELMQAFQRRGFGVYILLPAIIGVSPLGGIPALPSAMAVLVILFSVQVLAGRDRFWVPARLREASVSSERIEAVARKVTPVARLIDKYFGNRLKILTRDIAIRIVAAVCILLSAFVFPLELIPFAVAVPMSAVLLFGLAIVLHDGVLMLLAWTGSLVAFYGSWSLVPWV